MIIGVHGLYVFKNPNYMDLLLWALRGRGYRTYSFRYGLMTVIQTYFEWLESNKAKQLLKRLKNGDSLIGHSFGAVVINDTLKLLSEYNYKNPENPIKLNKVYLFNAALNSETQLNTEHVKKIYVFYDKKDWILKLASWLPGSLMGNMGQIGSTIPDSRIENIEIEDSDPPWRYVHKRIFTNKNYLEKYCDVIDKSEVE